LSNILAVIRKGKILLSNGTSTSLLKLTMNNDDPSASRRHPRSTSHPPAASRTPRNSQRSEANRVSCPICQAEVGCYPLAAQHFNTHSVSDRASIADSFFSLPAGFRRCSVADCCNIFWSTRTLINPLCTIHRARSSTVVSACASSPRASGNAAILEAPPADQPPAPPCVESPAVATARLVLTIV